MKVSIEFDPNEEYERQDVLKVVKANSCVDVIQSIIDELRRMDKYETCSDSRYIELLKDEKCAELVGYLREYVLDEIKEAGIGELF